MVAQHGVRSQENPTPLSYDSLRLCFAKVADFAFSHDASIHMPRIGCGLAGGRWVMVEKLVKKELIEMGIEVTVYDLPRK